MGEPEHVAGAREDDLGRVAALTAIWTRTLYS